MLAKIMVNTEYGCSYGYAILVGVFSGNFIQIDILYELILFSSKFVISAHEFKQIDGACLVDVKFQRLVMMVV